VSAADFIAIDLPALLAALLASLSCALVGNFLVLRRQSLMGDAISHAVLPGIVVGFIISGTRDAGPMLLGALAASLLAGLLIEIVRRYGRVESGGAMGVVFTGLFALGVVLLEQSGAHRVDLDVDCVLYGQLEALVWLGPRSWGDLLLVDSWGSLPAEVKQLAAVFLLTGLLIRLFFKELTLASFDPALADTLGFPALWLHFGLISLTALVTVASFEAVGSILVIAMLICPAALARLLTDNLRRQILLSMVAGAVAAGGGYGLATLGPAALGFSQAVNAAGSIATLAGLLLALGIVLAPRQGVLAKWRRSRVVHAAG
jgi:manganese/zinc/iron transport system permease protein